MQSLMLNTIVTDGNSVNFFQLFKCTDIGFPCGQVELQFKADLFKNHSAIRSNTENEKNRS